MSHPQIEVTPVDAAVDVRRKIRLAGFQPGPVQIVATLAHPDGSVWRSSATFVANADGSVDLEVQAPQHGDWNAADAMATVWSMQRQPPPPTSRAPRKPKR